MNVPETVEGTLNKLSRTFFSNIPRKRLTVFVVVVVGDGFLDVAAQRQMTSEWFAGITE